MAADTTAVKTAYVTLEANEAYTVNLTGAGSHITLVGTEHGNVRNIWFTVAGNETSLPTMTGGGDGERILHSNERIRVPAPRNDCWVRLFCTHAISLAVEIDATVY